MKLEIIIQFAFIVLSDFGLNVSAATTATTTSTDSTSSTSNMTSGTIMTGPKSYGEPVTTIY